MPRSGTGFTLLEVMVAIVLTSVVALMALASAQVSSDVRLRLGAALTEQQRVRATHEFLQDALRNARPSRGPDDPTFELRGGRLSFVAAGAGPPLDPDYDWRITIGADSGSLGVVATTVGRAPPTTVRFRLPRVTRWDVQALAADGSGWTHEWSDATTLPQAVALTLWHGAEVVGLPLQLTLERSSPRDQLARTGR